MKSRLILALAASLAATAFAAEPAAPAAAPAAPKAAAAPTVFKFSGDVDFRFRYHYVANMDTAGETSSSTGDYTNQYAWNLKLTATVSENLMFGARLSNPSGYSTDKIKDNSGWAPDANKILAIPEMYLKWNSNGVSVSAGLLQVLGNTALDLVAFESLNYVGVGKLPWAVAMNNSQGGAQLGYTVFKNKETTVDATVLAAVATDSAAALPKEALKRDKVRLVVSIPVALQGKKITITPVFATRLNAYRSKDLKDKHHSYTGGIDLGVKPIDMVGIRLGSGFGNFYYHDTGAAKTVHQPMGYLLNAGIDLKPAYGSGKLDFSYGLSRDNRSSKIVNNQLLYWDLIYSMPISKLNIVPRLRVWDYYSTPTNGTKVGYRWEVRPELILKAAF